MLTPFFTELVMSTDLLSFEHPSVLLFCLSRGSIFSRLSYSHLGNSIIGDKSFLCLLGYRKCMPRKCYFKRPTEIWQRDACMENIKQNKHKDATYILSTQRLRIDSGSCHEFWGLNKPPCLPPNWAIKRLYKVQPIYVIDTRRIFSS